MFVQGRTYRRRDLHETYGGQRQGGISTPARQPLILLFTGKTGEAYGYRDMWTEDGLFFYTGEGQKGDMAFVRGNRAVRDHSGDGKDLYLFEEVRTGHVRYIGQMICTGYHERQGPDLGGRQRTSIVFELSPIESFTVADDLDTTIQPTQPESLTALRERAFATTSYAATPEQRLALAHRRSRDVRIYVLARAKGTCEACGRLAPFKTTSGRLYLEAHHIRRLSDAGPDDPRWVIALCPNCHRRAHYGEDKAEFKRQITEAVHQKETWLADH